MIRIAAAAAGAGVLVSGAFQASPVLHEYADLNGVRLHYARTGTGPLILFVHGFPEFWYEWKHQLAEFGTDHTAVAPDMRGYNLSSKPTDLAAYQMPQLVEDIRALSATLLNCRGTGLRSEQRGDLSPFHDPGNAETCPRFTLVAHDWGGVVAWVFAAIHPEMLDKLVIVNAPHPTVFARELRENAAQQKASEYMLMFRGPEAEATLSANAFAGLKRGVLGGVSAEDTAAYVEAWSQPGGLTGGLNYYRASGIGPPKPGAGPSAPAAPAPPLLVKVPTLVIWGEKDTALLTGNLNGLEEYVPQLTVRRIPEGTHWVVRERPDEVNKLIREFLAQR